jgi:hypothetical protein
MAIPDLPDWKPGYFKAVGEIIPYHFTTRQGMIEHLERHRAAGHCVPERPFRRLLTEPYGEWDVEMAASIPIIGLASAGKIPLTVPKENTSD